MFVKVPKLSKDAMLESHIPQFHVGDAIEEHAGIFPRITNQSEASVETFPRTFDFAGRLLLSAAVINFNVGLYS